MNKTSNIRFLQLSPYIQLVMPKFGFHMYIAYVPTSLLHSTPLYTSQALKVLHMYGNQALIQKGDGPSNGHVITNLAEPIGWASVFSKVQTYNI